LQPIRRAVVIADGWRMKQLVAIFDDGCERNVFHGLAFFVGLRKSSSVAARPVLFSTISYVSEISDRADEQS